MDWFLNIVIVLTITIPSHGDNSSAITNSDFIWDKQQISPTRLSEIVREVREESGFDLANQPRAVTLTSPGNRTIVRYDGAQLWFVKGLNERNKYIIPVLTEVFGGVLWRINGKEMDILMDASVIAAADNFMKKAGQQYTVIFNDAQKLIDKQSSNFNTVDKLDWEGYHNFSVIESFLQTTATRYRNITKLEVIGYTFENRPLYVIRIGNGHPKNKAIWLDGGTHAREWISPASVTYIIKQLTENWNSLPAHIRQREWYIMPMVNPDGYEYSRIYDRFWHKNRRPLDECYGVDVNKNYDFSWGDRATISDPCFAFYRGDEPLSELETQSLTNFTLALTPKPSAFLTYHAYGQVILSPWAYKIGVPDNYRDLKSAAEIAIKAIKDSTGSEYTTMAAFEVFGPVLGAGDDWAKGVLGANYVYTVEMGNTEKFGFLVPTKNIKHFANEAMIIATTMSQILD